MAEAWGVATITKPYGTIVHVEVIPDEPLAGAEDRAHGAVSRQGERLYRELAVVHITTDVRSGRG